MRTGWLRGAGGLILVATVVFAVVLASRFGVDPGLVASPLLGKPAPGFDLPTMDGEATVTLDQLRGRVVVINFFASWCLECRKEHADLVATSDAFADREVVFIQIGYQEDPKKSLQWLGEVGMSSNTHYLADPGSRAAIAYGVFGIPETFFVDRDGVVVGKIIGESDALILGATIDAILRGETPGQTVTGDTRQRPGD